MKIGSYKLDFDRNEIRTEDSGAAKKFKMEPAPMQVLYLLAHNQNRVISRNQFVNEIWDGNLNVGDPALNKCISKIRSVTCREFIKTVPKKGYVISDSGKSFRLTKTNLPSHFYRAIVIAAVILIILAVIGNTHVFHWLSHRFH